MTLIRPLINKILAKFQEMPPPKMLALVVQICATKNRSYLKQYLPNEHRKWGYKFFMLGSVDGYIYNFELHTRDYFEELPNKPEWEGFVVM